MRIVLVLLAALSVGALSSPAGARIHHEHRLSCNVGQAWQPWPQYRRHRLRIFGRPGHFSDQARRCRRRW